MPKLLDLRCLTEDKADVNARVAWSGVGIDLRTSEPTSSVLREAVRTVLDRPDHRSRAALMAKSFRRIDTQCEILRILDGLVSDQATGLKRTLGWFLARGDHHWFQTIGYFGAFDKSALQQ